jgi:hypothetical protein
VFWRKKRPLDDFAAEIRSHLEHEADQVQESGQTREDAEAAARRAFGNVTLVVGLPGIGFPATSVSLSACCGGDLDLAQSSF